MLEKVKNWIDSHKYLAAAGLGLVIVAIYYVTHSGTPTQQAASGDAATNQYDAQIAQVQAQLAAQEQQNQTQLSIANLQANAQNSTIQAQLAATEDTNKTQLGLATVITGAQTTQQQNYESAYEKIYNDLITGQVSENASNNALAMQQTQLQAALEGQAITESGVSGSHVWGIQALESLQGQQGAIESSNSSLATQALAGALQTSSILGSITSGFGSLASSIF
jgi:hypothetical protein